MEVIWPFAFWEKDNCLPPGAIKFTSCKRRKVHANFGGGEITSDAGVMLLSEADKKLKLTERIAAKLTDPRCAGKCDHSLLDLLRQRIYAIALG